MKEYKRIHFTIFRNNFLYLFTKKSILFFFLHFHSRILQQIFCAQQLSVLNLIINNNRYNFFFFKDCSQKEQINESLIYFKYTVDCIKKTKVMLKKIVKIYRAFKRC
jgi:glycerol-3-phosphate O-acyltransferase